MESREQCEEHRRKPEASTGQRGSFLYVNHKKKKEEEPMILTITPPATQPATPLPSLHSCLVTPSKEATVNTPWKDQLLKKLQGKNSGSSILWLPGSGRHVSEGPDSYQPFTHIIRTLHLEDALQVSVQWRMKPKNITSFSSIDSRELPPGHPCANLKVLWFSASSPVDEEGAHDWYGNVEFAAKASVLLERWKYSFLVEMMTTPTHTTSRVLLTNTDHSAVLHPYDPYRAGGPWQINGEGQMALHKCSRFRFMGTNRHPHILEFLLEVTPEDEKRILHECKISFKNHEEAQDFKVRHVCNRYQRAKTPCPSPFTQETAATVFFTKLQQMNLTLKDIPKLSKNGLKLFQHCREQESIHGEALIGYSCYNGMLGGF